MRSVISTLRTAREHVSIYTEEAVQSTSNTTTQSVGTPLLQLSDPALVIECFVDFCCPFSRKLFETVSSIEPDTLRSHNADLVLQLTPQP